MISVVIGVFLGLLLVGGGILALAPRLQGKNNGGAPGAAPGNGDWASTDGGASSVWQRFMAWLEKVGIRKPKGPAGGVGSD